MSIPSAKPGAAGNPTGITFNASSDFAVTANGTSGPARFIFVSEDGMVSGWAPNVDATHAIKGWLNPDAVYKGVALAPAGFGAFSNRVLVGNFGDGVISAFDAHTGRFAGRLRSNGKVLKIDGLWGIAFGNCVQHQPTDTLFFAAGPNDEANGVYGRIDPASAGQGGEDGDDEDDGD